MGTESGINRRKGCEDTTAPTKVSHNNHQNKAEYFKSLCPEYFPVQH